MSRRECLLPSERQGYGQRAGWASLAAALLLLMLTACAGGESEPARPESVVTVVPDGAGATEPSGERPQGQNPGLGDNVVDGHTYDPQGRPLAGVDVYFYVVPRSFGSFYQAKSGVDGSYSYRLPEGVYRVFAEYSGPGSREPEIGEDLQTMDGELAVSITVPPSQTIDFQLVR
ncbi:hypothetical protein [Micromonospora sp. DT47]|uniref:hypothetical protein n=1 Tax=Micromonospora sp. DT47 TaxID=3393431 RepID=UPI003CE8BF6F